MIKKIGYAYQSSPMAKRLGANQTGCYYLATYKSELDKIERFLFGPFHKIEQAESIASKLNYEWSRYTKRAPNSVAMGATC